MTYQQHKRATHRREKVQKRRQSIKSKLLVTFIVISTVILALSLGALVSVFAYVDTLIPSDLTIAAASESTFIYDRNGEFLYEIHGDERRTNIPNEQIPEVIKQATIALEDKFFYEHKGVDLTGVVRSALLNVSTGSTVGGSTITQQLVREVFLTPEKTITRKVTEIFTAIRIEQRYSKEEILASYLNQINYGSGSYGIQAAAERYFRKNADELTLGEAAVLVGIPQRPTGNSPFSGKTFDLQDYLEIDIANPLDWYQQQCVRFSKIENERTVIDIWRQRQIKTLKLMMEQDFITLEQANAALDEPMAFTRPYETINAPHFVIYIRDLLTEKYGEKVIREGGLRVYTSLDMNLQRQAEQIVSDHVDEIRSQFNAHNASLMAMDPTTGEILAYVGSVDYFDEANDGNVDVVQFARQPGSSFKPFAYATAFKKGFSTESTVLDFYTDFGGGYRPRNYDGREHGVVTLRQGLANSYNVPAVKALYLGGIQQTVDTATDLGITTLDGQADNCGLSLTLGCPEVRLFDMVTAYSGFATMGKKVTPQPILKITDSAGTIVEELQPAEGAQVLDAGIAYMIADILSDNEARASAFGYNSALKVSRRAAVKTGTTNDIKDNWTVGFTPDLTVGVWVGNNNGDPLTGHASGVTGAAPIWHDFMEAAFGTVEATSWYPFPDSLGSVEIDNFSGFLPGPDTGDQVRSTLMLKSFISLLPVDDRRVKLTIDTSNNLIANPATPPELRQEKIFFKLKPEIPEEDPSYTRWNKAIEDYLNKLRETDPASPYLIPTEVSQSYYNGSNVPTVSILSHTNDQTVTSGTVTLEAAALGPYALTSVKFYLNNSPVSTITQMQDRYSYGYTLADGTYTLKVEATDDHGATGRAQVIIKVDTTFHIDITSPANHAIVGPTFLVQTGINSPGTVSSVVFKVDGTAQMTISTAPFEATLSASSGSHTINVVATDSASGTASDNIQVTVDADPPASFSPSGTCTIATGSTCPLSANPSDVGGAGIGHIEFYVNDALMQDFTSTSATYIFTPAAAGSYTVYAVAYDKVGNQRKSTVMTVTVS
ncbi:hypothetical protein AUK40_03960 [Candidatus Wirthbacteria bacterium CG2_30_54_11]|uniref:peptidoglycan glycosyltransferase n=1 Tax=Candidatus Wirthbacteria bacterium CG2_30_54_11 TaxID=1817892 RepID=A0A1J5IXX7_9BACT|nr:MAG: hypothetical protein AUK40_03960 [Candidatus Wirthbacteria bacterium CG2_30_54_11]